MSDSFVHSPRSLHAYVPVPITSPSASEYSTLSVFSFLWFEFFILFLVSLYSPRFALFPRFAGPRRAGDRIAAVGARHLPAAKPVGLSHAHGRLAAAAAADGVCDRRQVVCARGADTRGGRGRREAGWNESR